MAEKNVPQSVFDFVVANAREIIFNDTGVKAVLQKIQSTEGGAPKAIGHTAAMVLKSVQGGVKQNGLTIPPQILMAALKEIVGDLVELASVNGLVPEEQKKQVAAQAVQEGARMYGEKLPPPEQPQPQPQPQQAQPGIVGNAMGA